MKTAYKLVVVSPFGDYRRGDVIYDRKVVDAILDTNNLEMHQLDQNVRRVPLSLEEIDIIYRQQLPASDVAPVVTVVNEDVNVHLSSVSDNLQPEIFE